MDITNEINKLKKIAIIASSLTGCLIPLIILSAIIGAFVVLGLIKDSSETETASSDYLSKVYKECKSITVDGKIYSLENYIAGVVYRENGGAPEEALKAQAIASRTYAINRTNNCKKSIGNSESFQVFETDPSKIPDKAKKAANATAGQVLTYKGEIFSSEYDSFYKCGDFSCKDNECSTTYTRKPASEKHKVTIPQSRVPTGNGCNGHGRGMSQIAANYMAEEKGKKYDEILKYFYSDGVQISKLTEESSDGGTEGKKGSTFTSSSGKKYTNYKQMNYEKLRSTGCYITSIAILASGKDSSVTPMTVYNKNSGDFVNPGTVNHFLKNSKSLNYGSNKIVANNEKEFKNNLKSGTTYIIEFSVNWKNKGSCKHSNWTNSTHFVSVLDYRDSDNKVYISNPGSNQSTKTGWISFEKIKCSHIRVENP